MATSMSSTEAAMKVAKYSATAAANNLKKSGSASFARGYNFMVAIDDKLYSFMKVDGLETSAQMQYYNEGGNNRTAVPLRGSMASEHTLTLTYGVGKGAATLDILEPGKFLENNVTIIVLGEGLLSGKQNLYQLEGCYIKGINFGGLDASRSEIMINTMQIAYTSMKAYEGLR